MPFLPLLFDARGLSPTEIARVMFLVPVASLLVPSLWGVLADALHARVILIRVASIGAASSILLLYPDWRLAGSLFAMAFICFFRASITPLADAAAHAMLAEGRGRFATIRIWGSLGFALSAVLAGRLEVSRHPGRLVVLAAVVYFLSFLMALGLEAPPPERRPHVFMLTLRTIWSSSLPLVLLGTVFHYIGHSIFDVYFGLHLRALGYDDTFIGIGWAVGVFCEVAIMFFGPRLLARFDARRLMVFCTVVAVGRWLILSTAIERAPILFAQTLHAFTFGLWYLSMVKYVQDEAPEALRTSVQSVALTAVGLGMMFGYLLGGSIFEADGGRAVFRTAAVAALCATACYGLLAIKRVERAAT